VIEHEHKIVGTRKRLRDADNGRHCSFGWTIPSGWCPHPFGCLLLLEWRRRDGSEERHMTMMLPVMATRQSALSARPYVLMHTRRSDPRRTLLVRV
jgi:hypothetical protein